jgi:hypothetical protein
MPNRSRPTTPTTRKSHTPWEVVALMSAALIVLLLIVTGQFSSNSPGLRLIPPQQTSGAPATADTP